MLLAERVLGNRKLPSRPSLTTAAQNRSATKKRRGCNSGSSAAINLSKDRLVRQRERRK